MELASAIVTLFFVMDPLGNVPFFISVLDKVPKERRNKILLRELLIALAVLLLCLFFGSGFLALLKLDQASLGVAGGIVLFLIAIKMVFPTHEEDHCGPMQGEPFIVPLAIPMIVGPSTMSLVMIMTTQQPGKMSTWITAVLVAWFCNSAILLSSFQVNKLLGERSMVAVTRLMGMLLTAMSVQMVLSGIKLFIAQK